MHGMQVRFREKAGARGSKSSSAHEGYSNS